VAELPFARILSREAMAQLKSDFQHLLSKEQTRILQPDGERDPTAKPLQLAYRVFASREGLLGINAASSHHQVIRPVTGQTLPC